MGTQVFFESNQHIITRRATKKSCPTAAARLDVKLQRALERKDKRVGLQVFWERMAFYYIRQMTVRRADGSIDQDFAPNIKVGPGDAVQLLELADIRPQDRLLHLFSGAGYLTFFLSLRRPVVLDNIDLYTPRNYDLARTFTEAYQMVFGGLPENLRPNFTQPRNMLQDSARLPRLSGAPYNKIIITHPFGRMYGSITELEAMVLWLKAMNQVVQHNCGSFDTYSRFPAEWVKTVALIKIGEINTLDHMAASLKRDLREARFYQHRQAELEAMPTPQAQCLDQGFFARSRQLLQIGRVHQISDTASMPRVYYQTSHA